MELGATVCKPKQATCGGCVLRLQCEAFKQDKVYEFPVKEKKKKPINRYLNYVFVETSKQETYIRQRSDEGIWNKLYEFPLVETESVVVDVEALYQTAAWSTLFENEKYAMELVYQAKHQLSHQTLHANFWYLRGKNVKLPANRGFIKVPIQAIHDFAVPRLLERFLNTILP